MPSKSTNPIADRAADAIVALINSRPASPTKAEIAAVIAGNMGSSAVTRDVASTDAGRLIASGRALVEIRGDEIRGLIEHAWREHWSSVVTELEAACEVSGNLSETTPEGAAAEAVTKAAAARYDACCEKLWAVPPAQADIGLLAQVLYHQCHPGSTLTASDADQRLEEGPASEGGTINKAQAALLKAIRAQCLSS
jgi:hypothetical protein